VIDREDDLGRPWPTGKTILSVERKMKEKSEKRIKKKERKKHEVKRLKAVSSSVLLGSHWALRSVDAKFQCVYSEEFWTFFWPIS
jgi:hypothetical protein